MTMDSSISKLVLRTLRVRRWLAILASISAASLSSCTHQAYEGRPRPANEVALVRTSGRPLFLGYEGVTIKSVDTEWFPALASNAEILPGPHYISVSYEGADPGASYSSVRSCVIEFEARAGAVYQINYETDDWNRTWQAWLEDATTREKLADCSWNAVGRNQP